MIKNPKTGDYVWFICRWTDLPTLGVIATLGVDPPNKDFPYERPYAEVDWYNGENPSNPGSLCGNTSVLLENLYKTKQESLDSMYKETKHKVLVLGSMSQHKEIMNLVKRLEAPGDAIVDYAKPEGKDFEDVVSGIFDKIENCDIIFALKKPDGSIGKGLVYELEYARRLKKMVVCVSSDKDKKAEHKAEFLK